MDVFARYDLGPAALVPLDREIIARFGGARAYRLWADVDGSYRRLENSLEAVGDEAGAAAARRDHAAWKAASPHELDCGA